MIFEYTPRERAQLEAIIKEQSIIIDAATDEISKITETLSEESIELVRAGKSTEVPELKDLIETLYKQLSVIDQRFADLVVELDRQRFEKLDSPAAILEDAKNQTTAAIYYLYGRTIYMATGEKTEEDIQAENEVGKLSNGLVGIETPQTSWDRSIWINKAKRMDPVKVGHYLKGASVISYVNQFVLHRHIAALRGLKEADELADYIAKTMMLSPYVYIGQQEQAADVVPVDDLLNRSWMTIYHGKPTDQLAQISSRMALYDAYTESAIVDSGSMKVIFHDFKDIAGKFGVAEHKLLSVAVGYFTGRNNYSRSDKPARNLEAYIPLKEYAAACGYSVYEQPTSSPEEAAAEKKRATNALNDARKKIKTSLDMLYSVSLSWKENRGRGGQRDFEDMRIIQNKGIKKGYIKVKFSDDFGQILLSYPQTQYPIALLGIDPRNPNAYNIGLKMAEQHNVDNNQKSGTANILQVKTLPKRTNLPDIDTVRQQRASWDRRIKEPFENALDLLVKQGVLHDWKYTKAKGEDLTDEEAANITSYTVFENLYIVYDLENAPDHTERLARREEEKKRAEEKKQAGQKKKATNKKTA